MPAQEGGGGGGKKPGEGEVAPPSVLTHSLPGGSPWAGDREDGFEGQRDRIFSMPDFFFLSLSFFFVCLFVLFLFFTSFFLFVSFFSPLFFLVVSSFLSSPVFLYSFLSLRRLKESPLPSFSPKNPLLLGRFSRRDARASRKLTKEAKRRRRRRASVPIDKLKLIGR